MQLLPLLTAAIVTIGSPSHYDEMEDYMKELNFSEEAIMIVCKLEEILQELRGIQTELENKFPESCDSSLRGGLPDPYTGLPTHTGGDRNLPDDVE
jgi:hypothetical protein